MKLYQPSNGSEGCWFISDWCEKCSRDIWDPQTEKLTEQCDILDRTFFFALDEEKYPTEWRYCPLTNQPICMKFTTEKEPEYKPNPNQTSF